MNPLIVVLGFGLLILILAILVFLLFKIVKPSTENNSILAAIEKSQDRLDKVIRDEITNNRDEMTKSLRDQRQETTETVTKLGDSLATRIGEGTSVQKGQLEEFSSRLEIFARASGDRLDGVRSESAEGSKKLREEVLLTLKTLSETITNDLIEFKADQQNQLKLFSEQLDMFTTKSGERIDWFRVESSNGAKLLRDEVASAGKMQRDDVAISLKNITTSITSSLNEMSATQKDRLDAVSASVDKLVASNEMKMETLRNTLETRL